MCGIFTLLNSNENIKTIEPEFIKGKSRGPEFSKLDNNYIKMVLGFHRLAINGLNEISNQPLVINDIVLICNGEIYNYKTLYNYMNIEPITGSDCEVIIHLYLKYGIEQTLTMLDGVFSFILYDNRITEDLNNRLYVARDPYGVRPLYYLKSNGEKIGSIVFRKKTYLKEKGYPDVLELHIGFNENYQRQGFFQEALIELLEATDTPIFISSGRVINQDVFKAISKIDTTLLNVQKIEDGLIITEK